MRLNIEDNKGYVIVDDNTNQILDVYINTKHGVDSFDNRILNSYSRVGDKHYAL
jgi:hypothetical protein